MLTIDFVSDPACPWCWIGFSKLQRALTLWDGEPPSVTLRAFDLDPNIPRSGLPYDDYLTAKFAAADPERMKSVRAAIRDHAVSEGLEMNLQTMTWRANTRDAHRLIYWATGQGKARDMAEILFTANFRDNLNIGDRDILVHLAEQIGLNGEIIRHLLESDRDIAAIETEIRAMRSAGVSGVPVIIASGRFALQGAQDVPVILDFLSDASASLAGIPKTEMAQS